MKINMLSDYLKKTYGRKVYKLSLSGGMTCPNRDGTCGTEGCIFCSGSGSGEFAEEYDTDISNQIIRAKEKLNDKEKEHDGYIAYFQAFSNTYADVDYLRKLYTEVINRDDIMILSIATRPDCLEDEKIQLLSDLNKMKPVWVELGLQTSNNKTAEYIRRGYPLSVYQETACKLRAMGITVITHLILGLPGETKADMIESAKIAGEYSDGIKFHMLYIQENTALSHIFKNDKIKLLSLEEYTDILCDCIRYIPENTVIHRITGDAPKDSLVAPLWSADKIKVLREINNAFYDKNLTQGEYLKNKQI